MNYYTNSNNDCCMNNRFNDYSDEYAYNDFDQNNNYYSSNSDYYNHEKNNYKEHSCCVKKVEETFCCYPSYYNEEKKDDQKEKCFEGTFKICPKCYENKQCHNFQECDNHKRDEHKCNCRCHNRCNFCRLFRFW